MKFTYNTRVIGLPLYLSEQLIESRRRTPNITDSVKRFVIKNRTKLNYIKAKRLHLMWVQKSITDRFCRLISVVVLIFTSLLPIVALILLWTRFLSTKTAISSAQTRSTFIRAVLALGDLPVERYELGTTGKRHCAGFVLRVGVKVIVQNVFFALSLC